MKHVVVLNQFALPRTEGGGTRHIDLFSRVEGWQVLIIAGNRNHYSQQPFTTNEERFALVRVPRQAGGGASRLIGWLSFSFQAFFIAVTRRQLDLVYGSSPHLLAPLAGLLAARLRRVPFVLEVRDLWPESIVAAGRIRRGSLLHQFFMALEKYLTVHASLIVGVTQGWEDHFAALDVPTDRLVIVSNGTEPSDFCATRSRAELRTMHRFTGFTAVFAGAHGPKDGIDLILDAAAELPEMNFVLIGDGPSKSAAVTRARQHGLVNVELRDPVPKQELADLLRAADVGIHAVTPLPVFARGMSPNKLFDYMASALPVVSNAGEGLRNVFVDGECGHLGGPASLGESLRKVFEADEITRDRWGRLGRQLIERRFSRASAARRLRTALEDVVTVRSATVSMSGPVHMVAHVTTAHRSTDNRIMRKECVALREADIDVCLVAVHPQDEILEGVPIIALPARVGRIARMVIGPVDVWRRLRQIKPKLVHIHDPELIPLALLWRLRRGRSTVFDAHEDLPKQVLGKPYIPRPMRRLIAMLARVLEAAANIGLDGIVAATPAIARNFNAENVTLVQNFPWLRDFPNPVAADPSVKAKLSYVGGVTRERGGVEMITSALNSSLHPELVLAGPATVDMKNMMEKHRDRGINYLGQLPVSRVADIIADSRAGLVLFHPLANHLECQPTKLFEYMAAGRPFVASDFAYWRNLLGPFKCGLFVDPLDPEAVRSAIDMILSEPERCHDMGMAGRRALEGNFTFEHEAPRLVNLTFRMLRE